MLIPRRTKFRKQHRPHRTGLSKGGNRIAFGDYAIQALEPAYLTNVVSKLLMTGDNGSLSHNEIHVMLNYAIEQTQSY